MKKILFYCQYLAGMGHLVRSTEIIRRLVQDFQVCFVNGGQPIASFELPPTSDVVHLPALWEEAGELKAIESHVSIETIKAERTQKLLNIFEEFQPDCIILECFPFSKHRLKFELLPLLDRARSAAFPVKIVCSVRDLIMTQTWSEKERSKRCSLIQDWLNQYFDLVLVHGDPQVHTLNDFFPYINQLQCDVSYTGYVAQTPPQLLPVTTEDILALDDPTPMIVASVGGGRFGYELLHAIAAASKILEKSIPHHIYGFAGPFMPEEQFFQLQNAIARQSNITIRRYTSHLLHYMEQADLSISLGGYNTTMNLLRTGVRSIVFPFSSEEQAGEQSIRAEKLEQLDVLEILRPDELTGDRLATRILKTLDRDFIPAQFDLQGAEKSALCLQALLNSVPVPA